MNVITIEALQEELEIGLGISSEEFYSAYNALKDEYGTSLHLMTREDLKTRLLILIEDTDER